MFVERILSADLLIVKQRFFDQFLRQRKNLVKVSFNLKTVMISSRKCPIDLRILVIELNEINVPGGCRLVASSENAAAAIIE